MSRNHEPATGQSKPTHGMNSTAVGSEQLRHGPEEQLIPLEASEKKAWAYTREQTLSPAAFSSSTLF